MGTCISKEDDDRRRKTSSSSSAISKKKRSNTTTTTVVAQTRSSNSNKPTAGNSNVNRKPQKSPRGGQQQKGSHNVVTFETSTDVPMNTANVLHSSESKRNDSMESRKSSTGLSTGGDHHRQPAEQSACSPSRNPLVNTPHSIKQAEELHPRSLEDPDGGAAISESSTLENMHGGHTPPAAQPPRMFAPSGAVFSSSLAFQGSDPFGDANHTNNAGQQQQVFDFCSNDTPNPSGLGPRPSIDSFGTLRTSSRSASRHSLLQGSSKSDSFGPVNSTAKPPEKILLPQLAPSDPQANAGDVKIPKRWRKHKA